MNDTCNNSDRKHMPFPFRIDSEKKRAIAAVASTVVIVTLLGVYAVFVNPGYKPDKVTVTGTVTAPSGNVDKIVFTNTGCGTKSEATVSSNRGASGTYTISLDNEYSYNVKAAWNGGEGAIETAIGTLALDTSKESLVQDWTIQP